MEMQTVLSRKPCKQCCQEDEGFEGQVMSISEVVPETTSNFDELQKGDEDVGPVLQAKASVTKPSEKERASWSVKARRLLEHWDALVVTDGALYRCWTSADGAVVRHQLVVPRRMIKDIIREAHATLTAGPFWIGKNPWEELGRDTSRVGMRNDFPFRLERM